jgi:hypothetical protein
MRSTSELGNGRMSTDCTRPPQARRDALLPDCGRPATNFLPTRLGMSSEANPACFSSATLNKGGAEQGSPPPTPRAWHAV